MHWVKSILCITSSQTPSPPAMLPSYAYNNDAKTLTSKCKYEESHLPSMKAADENFVINTVSAFLLFFPKFSAIHHMSPQQTSPSRLSQTAFEPLCFRQHRTSSSWKLSHLQHIRCGDIYEDNFKDLSS